jgi:3-phenylpropionate/trans-cinnamate dioxygenase ferredoxin component
MHMPKGDHVLNWWREAKLSQSEAVAKVSDFREDIVRVFKVGKEEIAVVNHGGRWYAFQGYCTHALYSFNYTRIRPGDQILCSSHFAWFDLASGRVLSGPAGDDLAQYDVRVEGDDVLVSSKTAAR